MADIQPNSRGKLQRARKRLRRHLLQLNDAGSLTAAQRDQLFAEVLSDLTRIQLYILGQSTGEES